MNPSFFKRSRWYVLAAVAGVLPALLWGVFGSLSNFHNDVRDWLPQHFPETRQYAWFVQHFEAEEAAVISWPGCTLHDQRLKDLAGALEDAEFATGEMAGQKMFRQVLTGPAVIEQMVKDLRITQAEAAQRLRGSLVGYDNEASCIVAMINHDPLGNVDRHQAVQQVYELADARCGIAPIDLRMGGPTIDNVAVDNESQKMLFVLAAGSALLAVLLAWWCLQSVRLTLIVFATALLSEGLSVAIVYYTGALMDAVLIMMPTVVYVCGMSGAIHLVNYYREAIPKVGIDRAATEAVRVGWLPCTLAALTTSLGLASLTVSQVVPVKMFGIYSAVGVLAMLVFLLLLLPCLLEIFPINAGEAGSSRTLSESMLRRQQKLGNFWQRLASLCIRRHQWITLGLMAALAVTAVGLGRIETSVKLQNLFAPNSRILRDYAWLEEHIGPLVPVEVVLQFDEDSPLSFNERIALVGKVQQRIDEIDRVGGTMSAATFAPELRSGGGLFSAFQRNSARKLTEQNRMRFVELQYLYDPARQEPAQHWTSEPPGELWRVSARIEALNDIDYSQYINRLRDEVEPILDQARDDNGNRVAAIYTGVMPLIYKSQRQLLNDLVVSFITAFVLIALAMAIMLRSAISGLLAMVPNVFPAVLVFGVIGWSGMLVDIGSMMTASVAMGIAVDDTLHFITWYYRGMQQGQHPRRAIRYTYQHCATAMLQTSIVVGVGLLLFSLSNFMPTARFAWLMLFLLVAALVGDLVLLPAMLAGPLGRAFGRRISLSEPVEPAPMPAQDLPQPAVPEHVQVRA